MGHGDVLLERSLFELVHRIGSRPVGSIANQRAVSYVERVFRGQGLEVELQTFDCIDWKREGGTLFYRGFEIPILPADYSNPCQIEAPSVAVATLEELKERQLEGSIAFLYGDLAREPLMPKNFPFYNPERDKEIIGLLEEKRPQAIITTSPSKGEYIPLIEDGDFHIPCGIVLERDANRLKEEGVFLELEMKTKRAPSHGSNVIAYLNRGHPSPWVFSAHIDTKPGTPGALDNGGGVATLLALSERLKERKDIGVEFVVFNGEDYYSNPGEVLYLEKRGHLFPTFKGAINCDGVGLKGSKIGLAYMHLPPSLEKSLKVLMEEYEDLEELDPWVEGDHMIFAIHEVPVVAITSTGIFHLLDTVVHTKRDTLDLIDRDRLKALVNFLAQTPLLDMDTRE